MDSFKLFFESEWQKFNRQRLLPFAHNHEKPFQKYAKSVLGSEVEDLDDSQYEPGMLYHVTTNLKQIQIDRQLKSRNQTGIIGLGGGPSNMTPHLISLTYNYGKALEIYEGLKFIVQIVNGQIPASEIYNYIINQNDNCFDDFDRLSNVDKVLIDHGIPKKIIMDGYENKIKQIINKNITTPEQKYEFLQELEKAVIEDNPPIDNDENLYFDPVIGFTAPFESIKNLKQNNIAIIQVVIRKSADAEHYQQEAEIRTNPEDLSILRFIQP